MVNLHEDVHETLLEEMIGSGISNRGNPLKNSPAIYQESNANAWQKPYKMRTFYNSS
jgi:hypothetical protein